MNVFFNRRWLAVVLFFVSITVVAQKSKNLVYVDKQGVMRYTTTKKEASFFGVNYTTPFAHAYRAHKALGLDLEKAIQNDVYHLARLGFQAFRIHIWDTEISDTEGNLLNNEHLRLFDFLLAELKKRNIKTVITPIAFWGNGYPERDEPTPGFSRYFGRGKLTTNDTAIRAQENFMRQFFKHVNPYTQQTYEQDKDIIAVELNNEPSHSDPKKGVTDYINRLAAAVRSTGWSKPVFYNIAQGPYFSDAVAAAKIDGVSFQWYPSGLVGNQTLQGNTLMHVDRYRIPFRDTVPAFRNKALMVYEFDAADIMSSYMYPAMAKAFRGAGFQWATQFAYDPLAIAHVNTEYQTHYLNLAYTPAKAISMMIAAEIFTRVPRMKSYGGYPADSSFDAFRLSYANDLSEMNTEDKFYYSNTTTTRPLAINKLQHIAGTGSSPVVQYKGTGAYFLDKIANGVWRLEVMPDAVPIRDPYERASPKKTVTAIEWNTQEINIQLPDLGEGFVVKGLGNTSSLAGVNGNKLMARPGIYLLTAKEATVDLAANTTIGTIGLHEFVAPAATNAEITMRHTPLTAISSGQSFDIKAIVGGVDTGRVTVQLNRGGGRGGFGSSMLPMQRVGNEYQVTVPAQWVTDGQLQYRIFVQKGEDYKAFPGGINGNPFAWDSYGAEYYKIDVAAAKAAIELYNPSLHSPASVSPNFRRGFQNSFVSADVAGKRWHQFTLTEMVDDDAIGLQQYIGNQLEGRRSELSGFDELIVKVRTLNQSDLDLNVGLVNAYGTAFSKTITAGSEWKEYKIPINQLVKDSSLLLPRPYPGFQPLFFSSTETNAVLQLATVEKLQIRTLPASPGAAKKDISFQIEWVRLSHSKK